MNVRALSEDERECICFALHRTVMEFFEEHELRASLSGDDECKKFVIRVHGRFVDDSLDVDEVAH